MLCPVPRESRPVAHRHSDSKSKFKHLSKSDRKSDNDLVCHTKSESESDLLLESYVSADTESEAPVLSNLESESWHSSSSSRFKLSFC